MFRIFFSLTLVLSLTIILFSTKDLVWDEWYHIPLGRQLFEQGLSVSFLRNMNVAMGPFYAMILSLCFHFTDGAISIQGLRAINWFFMLGLLYLISRTFSFSKNSRIQSAVVGLSIPFVSLMSMFAMSDIPALFFFFLSLFLLKQAHVNQLNFRLTDALVALAGLSLGFCILIRQTYLVSFCGILWLALREPQKRRLTAIYTLMAIPLPLVLFYSWGGITPPLIAAIETQRGHFSSTHFLLATSQTALVYYFFFPKRLINQKFLFVGTSILFLFLTPWISEYLVSNLSERLPLRFIFQSLLGGWHTRVATFFLVITFAMGFLFLIDLTKQFLRTSDVIFQSLLLSGTALVCYPLFVTSNYSSRYPLAGLLLLVLIEDEAQKMSGIWRLARFSLGCGIGLCVGGYYLRVFS